MPVSTEVQLTSCARVTVGQVADQLTANPEFVGNPRHIRQRVDLIYANMLGTPDGRGRAY